MEVAVDFDDPRAGDIEIDAAHFLGLAHLYAEKGENVRAIECLEVSKAKDLANPANHKLHGKLLFRRRDFDGAAEEFGRA